MNDENEEKCRKDLQIDFFRLEECWLEQPTLFMTYGEIQAEFAKKRDEASRRLRKKQAEIARDIRENPENYNINKVTDGAIKEAIQIYKELNSQEEQKALIEAQFQADRWEARKWAFQQRKEALQGLVELYKCGYFIVPNAPKQLIEIQDKLDEKRTEMEQREALKETANKLIGRIKLVEET